MDQQEINQFLAGTKIAVMATINRDGSPRLTPKWYYYDGEKVIFITTKERLQFVNLRRDARISLCIYEARIAANYVVIRGRTSMDDRDIWDDARRIVARYVELERVEEYISRMKTEPRVLVTVTPERIHTRYR